MGSEAREATAVRSGTRFDDTLWIMRRRLALARAALLDRAFYLPAVATALAVWLIGVLEGWVLATGPDTWPFALRYGLANILPSLIWSSQEAETVALAAGYDPEVLLVSLEGVEGARLALWASDLYTLRALLGGFAFINYVLRVAGIASEARSAYRERIFAGREPPRPAPAGRVVRLAGRVSDVTELSLQRMGGTLWPVYKAPEAIEPLVEAHGNGRLPLFWRVAEGEYGRRASWEGLEIGPDWLLRSRAGCGVLLLEADATVSEQALALAPEGAADLDLQEVAQGFRALQQSAERGGAAPGRVTRVLLADLQRAVETGGGYRYTLRGWIERYREADLLVDARAPLLEALLAWLEPHAERGGEVAFNTHHAGCFELLGAQLGARGYRVVDSSTLAPEAACPRIVYHRTTADTVHVVRALVRHHGVPAARVCALIDRAEGLEAVAELADEIGSPVAAICSAGIYDALLRDVRERVLADETDDAIQAWLDARFGGFYGQEARE